MAQPSTPHVNVVVFKDQQVARTFELPLGWLSRLSWAIAGLFALLVGLSAIAIHEYRLARRFDPSRIVDLEQQLRELRDAQGHSTRTAPVTPPQAPTTEALAPPAAGVAPVPTVTVTLTPTAGGAASPAGEAPLFQALPAGSALPDATQTEQTPVKIQAPKATWSGNSLRLRFALQYTGPANGNLQGRIAVIARGSDTVLGYPDGIFGNGNGTALLHPEKGEYFSVSRFRDTQVNFAPVRSRASIQTLDLLLFSLDGKLLMHQKITPSATAQAPKPVAPASGVAPAAPATSPAAAAASEATPGATP